MLSKLRPLTESLIIRPATTADRPRLRQAIVALQDYERARHTTRLQVLWSIHQGTGRRPARPETQSAVLVAESNGTFAGFVAGWIDETENVGETPNSNRVGYISDICVMPDFRGRRIAPQLLSRIEQHLGRAGVTRLRINSLAANQSARASYEHAGFLPYEIIYEKMIVAQD